jgi:hypothetical protein
VNRYNLIIFNFRKIFKEINTNVLAITMKFRKISLIRIAARSNSANCKQVAGPLKKINAYWRQWSSLDVATGPRLLRDSAIGTEFNVSKDGPAFYSPDWSRVIGLK